MVLVEAECLVGEHGATPGLSKVVINKSVSWIMSDGSDVLILDLFDGTLDDISKRIHSFSNKLISTNMEILRPSQRRPKRLKLVAVPPWSGIRWKS